MDGSHLSLRSLSVSSCLQGTKDMRQGPHLWQGSGNFIQPLTTLDVEGMVFVQAPSSQLGSIDFIALQHCCSLFPQDQIWAGFILVTHRNCRWQKAQKAQVSKGSSLALDLHVRSLLVTCRKGERILFLCGTRSVYNTN